MADNRHEKYGIKWANFVFLTLSVLVLSSPFFPVPQVKGGSIKGRILNKQTKEPLVNVKVKILEIDRTTRSDGSGTFGFTDIPEGEYSIEFILP